MKNNKTFSILQYKISNNYMKTIILLFVNLEIREYNKIIIQKW